MSLTDSDKQKGDRANPRLNADDNVANRMAHNTAGITYRTTGSGVIPRMAFKNGMILSYDSENRVSSVFAYIPELADIPVLIIAKEGYDIFEDILSLTPPTT